MKKYNQCRNGQAMVEYILMVGAVILILYIFASRGGFFERELDSALKTNLNSMEDAASHVFN